MVLFNNYLHGRGWSREPHEGPVDQAGNPLPWITYCSTSVLAQIVKPDHRVFEFGCGHSSLWWAERAQEVVSVENHEGWAARISERAPPNLTVHHVGRDAPYSEPPAYIRLGLQKLAHQQPLSGNQEMDDIHGVSILPFVAYALTLTRYPKGHFDIIVCDGMARSFTAWLAGLWVKPGGVVVIDNSDRWQYTNGMEALREFGFGRIDFWGVGPVNNYEGCTSLFAKSMDAFLRVPVREKVPVDIGW